MLVQYILKLNISIYAHGKSRGILLGGRVVREDFRIRQAYLKEVKYDPDFSVYLSLPPQITRPGPGPPFVCNLWDNMCRNRGL